jgi:hypothetical protein
MWDIGAEYNFMHELEANRLGLQLQSARLASVQVGNEDTLEVIGMSIACVTINDKCHSNLEFNITKRLPYRVILGLKGMQKLNIMVDPTTMSLYIKHFEVTSEIF